MPVMYPLSFRHDILKTQIVVSSLVHSHRSSRGFNENSGVKMYSGKASANNLRYPSHLRKPKRGPAFTSFSGSSVRVGRSRNGNQLGRCESVFVCVCQVTSVVSDSLRPHELQPARLLCPWDSPGKNTGVSCHALLWSLSLLTIYLPWGPFFLILSFLLGRVGIPMNFCQDH